jgi:predicted amidohydrolase YtcJ
VGFGEGYEAKKNAQGKFMCPGLIDGHIHLESTFLSPIEFCSVMIVVVPVIAIMPQAINGDDDYSGYEPNCYAFCGGSEFHLGFGFHHHHY